MNLTGKTYTTTIFNDKGEFLLKDISLSTNYVQLSVDGFFFNELKGKLSDTQITLFAISDIKDIKDINSINVNVLTHLEVERVKQLVQKENKTFDQAKKQALQEVLNAFYIKDELNRSESLDLTANTNASHILLAVSSIIINEDKEALMTQFMSKIRTDLADNGILDNESLKTQIDTTCVSLYKWSDVTSVKIPPMQKIEQIRSNTIAKYKELGINLDLTYFERYIDKNGNRDISDNRPNNLDNIAFTSITNVNKADFLYFSNEVTFDGISDSIVMWIPSYSMGYKKSTPTLKTYFCGSGSGNFIKDLNLKLKDKYGVHPKYKFETPFTDSELTFDYLYLNNGLIVGWYENKNGLSAKREDCFMLPNIHVYINDTPINAYTIETHKFTIHKGDKLKVAINPYHALYDPDIHKNFSPSSTLDVPEHLFRGQTALGTIFIEGKQINFSVSLNK